MVSSSLYGDKEFFDIFSTSEKTQNILEESYTEWSWRIKPLKSGKSYLKLTIKLPNKEIVVYEQDILVESDFIFSFKSFLSKWWQAITATIITPILIPFLIWAYRRKNIK